MPAVELWRAGLGLGLLTGLLEVLWLSGLGASGAALRLGRGLIWMAPVSNLCWFLPVTGGLLWAIRRTRLALPGALGALVGLATVGVLLVGHQIHWAAVLVLGTGAAVQTARFTRRRPDSARRLFRGAAFASAVAVCGGGVSLTFADWLRERRALQALPPAQGLNLLLLVLDTVGATDLTLYGSPLASSPALDRWAGEGVVFDQAFATSPWTLPSHASLFTGRWAHELSANWRVPLDATSPTLAEVLQRRGYRTAGFVANLYFCDRNWGLARGFTHYEDEPLSLGELLVSSSLGRVITDFAPLRRLLGFHEMLGRKSAGQVNQAFLQWLDRNPGRPFFAFLNYLDAHQPYLPPPQFAGRFASGPPLPRRHRYRYRLHDVFIDPRVEYTPAERAAERQAHEEAIADLDREIGRLLDTLAGRGVLDKTVLIVVSDHGEQFGEHGLLGHGNSVFASLLHVPLLFRLPGTVPAGRRIGSPVSLRDVPATALELVGTPPGSGLPGRSLTRYWLDPAGSAAPPDPVLADLTWENITYRSVVEGPYHYLHQSNNIEQLFDLVSDPEERRDLRDSAAFEPVLARNRRWLDSLWR